MSTTQLRNLIDSGVFMDAISQGRQLLGNPLDPKPLAGEESSALCGHVERATKLLMGTIHESSTAFNAVGHLSRKLSTLRLLVAASGDGMPAAGVESLFPSFVGITEEYKALAVCFGSQAPEQTSEFELVRLVLQGRLPHNINPIVGQLALLADDGAEVPAYVVNNMLTTVGHMREVVSKTASAHTGPLNGELSRFMDLLVAGEAVPAQNVPVLRESGRAILAEYGKMTSQLAKSFPLA